VLSQPAHDAFRTRVRAVPDSKWRLAPFADSGACEHPGTVVQRRPTRSSKGPAERPYDPAIQRATRPEGS
jgi:hypothetical protein